LLTMGAVCGRIGTTLFPSGDPMEGDRRGCVSGWPVSPLCSAQRCEHAFVPWLRCPNCADWSEPQHWERGTHSADPHAVRCPSCGEWCDPSDQTMRIGERPDNRRSRGPRAPAV
jgi:hypothetical protein